MNDAERHDHPQRAQCSHVGAQSGDLTIREGRDGRPWEVESPLYLMGLHVGEVVGRGPTREAAEADLRRLLHEASESLFA